MTRTLIATLALLVAGATPALGQSFPLRFKQTRDGAQVQVLTAAESATLGDPLFNLLLKEKANTVKLANIEAALQPTAADRRLFIVSERIVSSAKVGSQRAVLAFDGSNGGETLKGNVMLSASFGPNGFAELGAIEAWGWDNHRGRYNYYKLDAIGSANGALTWKFRGSSDNADLLTPAERTGTCLACHVTGAPVMKELRFPWNNWHAGVGGSFKADYLVPNSPNPNKWPAADTARFKQLKGADELETDFLIPAFKRFNQSRLNTALKRDDDTGNRAVTADGRLTVLEGRRLLRPLFETVEINLISSRDSSGVHPFGQPTDFVPELDIRLPDNFFLNTNLIAGGNGIGGLKRTTARGFQNFAKLTQQENKELIDKFQLRLRGVVGDTNFGWFVPEPGFVDNDLADKLLQQGVVTPHFVAAVLAVDLESPVFSTRRRELLDFVPERFEFTPVPAGTDPTELPRDAEKDLLTKVVVAALEQASPAVGSAADDFRTLLKATDAVQELDQRVKNYVTRVRAELNPAMPNRRKAELERLYKVLMERRRALRSHAVLKNLDETNGQLLFPLPVGE